MRDFSQFSELILDWYARNKREMPWRDVKDPYKVWISEVMLQQTRVDTVIPYYHRWMAKFPNIASLAAVEQEEALKAWEGLGYYSRARKLLDAAKIIMNQHNGVIPSDPQDLRQLPGIGAYTAAAIASFAFNADTFPVDGNINRVFARVFGILATLGSREFSDMIEQRRAEVFPHGRSADFNQGLMDLGATICLPKCPKCAQCPVLVMCVSSEDPERLPIQDEKKKIPTVYKIAAVLACEGKVLVYQRAENGLLGGLFEFPSVEGHKGTSIDEAIAYFEMSLGTRASESGYMTEIRHAYTHFKVVESVYYLKIERPPKSIFEGRWVTVSELNSLPMGKIDRSIANQLGGNAIV